MIMIIYFGSLSIFKNLKYIFKYGPKSYKIHLKKLSAISLSSPNHERSHICLNSALPPA